MSEPTATTTTATTTTTENTTAATNSESARYIPKLYSKPRTRYLHDQQQGGGINMTMEIGGGSRKVGINISFRLSMLGAIDKVAAKKKLSRSAFVAMAVQEKLESQEIRAILDSERGA